MVRAIRLQIGDKVEVVGDEAGMHLVMLLPAGINDVVVSKRAAQRGVSAMPLSSCYLRAPDMRGLILGYGGTNQRQIQEGVSKLRMSIDAK